jgi:hypothetical protein
MTAAKLGIAHKLPLADSVMLATARIRGAPFFGHRIRIPTVLQACAMSPRSVAEGGRSAIIEWSLMNTPKTAWPLIGL